MINILKNRVSFHGNRQLGLRSPLIIIIYLIDESLSSMWFRIYSNEKKTEIKSNIIGNYFGFSYKSSLKKINTTYEKSLIIEIEDSYVVMEEH